jgi:hypothetical protein
MARRHPSLSLLVPVALALAACNKAPAEPDRPASASSEPPAPTVPPLQFDAPGIWTKLPTPPTGPKKATYRIDKVGNDKEEAEMTVSFFGTGSKGDPAVNFKEWADQFDGNAGAGAAREQSEVHGFKVETIEIKGTYKISLTPPSKSHKRSPVQMVKNDWRLYGAVVKTTDRGNWFFKIVGPDETVQSAKSAFKGMLETMR